MYNIVLVFIQPRVHTAKIRDDLFYKRKIIPSLFFCEENLRSQQAGLSNSISIPNIKRRVICADAPAQSLGRSHPSRMMPFILAVQSSGKKMIRPRSSSSSWISRLRRSPHLRRLAQLPSGASSPLRWPSSLPIRTLADRPRRWFPPSPVLLVAASTHACNSCTYGFQLSAAPVIVPPHLAVHAR